MNIYVEKSIERIDKSQWNALAQKNATNTIFQTYEWNQAVEHVYGQPEGSFILCVKDKDELIAIVPFMFFTIGGRRVLQFMAGHLSDYCDMLCPGRQEDVLELVWQYIFSRRKEWDLIHLRNVPCDVALSKYVKGNNILKGLSHRNLYNKSVSLRFHDDEAYTKSILNKKNIRWYRNRFKKDGQYEVLHLTRPADIEIYIKDFFLQHIERWRRTRTSSFFNDEKNQQFYRYITRALPPESNIFSVLKWKGQALGYYWGFSYEKRFMCYLQATNLAFAEYSPGTVLLQEVMEYAYALGFEEFDMGIGKEAFKHRFGNVIKNNNSFKVYHSRFENFCDYLPLVIKEQLKALAT